MVRCDGLWCEPDATGAVGRAAANWVYTLPTEAQWEYACRAGTTTPFGVGSGTSLSSMQANFDGNFPYGGAATGPYLLRTAVVGSYPANAWGLYDMHGNVAEWCLDWYGPYPGGSVTDPLGVGSGSQRVMRGGDLGARSAWCRSASRYSLAPSVSSYAIGFRIVLVSVP